MRNMKKIFLLISAILLIVPVQAQHTLRLMTYNIKNATGMDGVCDFQRIANVINNASPDVVAVQEVDSVTNRSNQKYVLGEIAERTQMYACFAPAIDYDGGKYGIGLLSKKAPVHLQTIALPGREEARALILAEFEDYIYCCTHLSLTEEDRMKSLEILKTFAASYKKPLFLAGDMNAEPESDFIKELQKEFRILSNPKQHTFPAPAPKETIDYVAAFKQNDKGFAVVSSEVVNEPVASDHRPIVVELRTAEKACFNGSEGVGNLMLSRHMQRIDLILIGKLCFCQGTLQNRTSLHLWNRNRCMLFSSGFLHDGTHRFWIVRRYHNRTVFLDDACFLGCNFRQCISQNRHMVKRNRRNHADQWVFYHVGCIQQATQSSFQKD